MVVIGTDYLVDGSGLGGEGGQMAVAFGREAVGVGGVCRFKRSGSAGEFLGAVSAGRFGAGVSFEEEAFRFVEF